MKKPLKKLTWFYLIPSLLGCFWIAASIFFAALSFHVFSRLTDEEPIAKIFFKPKDQQIYTAYLYTSKDRLREYLIYGDQWRIDAQFIKLKNWANLIGLDALYKLERIEGRYLQVEEQNKLPNFAYDLSNNLPIHIPQFVIDYNFLVDTEYGSSAYMNIDITKIYTIYRTQSGLLIRAKTSPEYVQEKGVLRKIFDVF